MFARFFRSSSNNDLEAYRRGYPGKTDNNDPRQNKNLLFYRNQHPMEPDQILIDMFHERVFGKYSALESGHSFIQWLFPIQEESPFNWQAQQLQKHEIAAMKRDGAVLQRIFKSLELMLDFYGFDVKVADQTQTQRAKSTSCDNNKTDNTTQDGAQAAENENNENNNDGAVEDNIEDEEYDYLKYEKEKNKNKKTKPDKEKLVDSEPASSNNKPSSPSKTKGDKKSNQDGDDDGVEEGEAEENEEEDEYANFNWSNLNNARCDVTRQLDDRLARAKFNNLINHTHNNLRITRILKCLGEMGLENMKIAVLVAFRREIFETGALRDLADSYMNYWSGTLYNDEFRSQFQTVPTEFQPRGMKRKQ